MRRIKRGETVHGLELRLRRLDQGWEKIVSYSGAMVESTRGERLMFVSVQDLTEQRKAEQSLRESEERLRLLGDNLPDSAVYQYLHEADGTARFTYFTGGIERLVGLTPEDVLRDAGALYNRVLPDHIDRLMQAETRSKRDLSDFDIEVPLRRSDGQVRWMHLHSRPRPLPDGRTLWNGVQTDVTTRKQTEDALKKQADLLRLSNDAMIVCQLDGGIEMWNAGAERLYGYSDTEAAGKVTRTLLATQFPTPWDEIIAELRSAGSWQGELRQRTRDECEVVVSSRLQLFQGSDGIERVLEVNRDMTEARREQMEAFARQKLESLGTLAGGIAHDFNNLMASVLAQAELASARVTAGTAPEQELNAIKEIATRGADLVRQLLIYAGKEADVVEPVNLSKTVEEMLGLLRSSISKRAALVVDLKDRLPAVQARAAPIRQILMNLVVNASDSIEHRDGTISVTTDCVIVGPNPTGPATDDLPGGEYVRLEVSDTGCGMSRDITARIFDPFFSTKATGRGLGLAVTHGIVRSLGGAIRVTTEVGKGTAVQVLLPSAAGMAIPQTGDTVADTNQESHSSTPATVLLVEDEAPLRVAVHKMLERAGFTVLEAADGSAAVDLLRAHQLSIDVVFLDVTIPGRPCHEVLSEAVRRRPQVKVILTSAHSGETVTAMLGSLPAHAFIRKPFRLATVVSALRNALSPP
jgi:PAS domain S-box-containing protein